jgi:hypothetical protein
MDCFFEFLDVASEEYGSCTWPETNAYDIAFNADGKLKTIPAGGGPARSICDSAGGTGTGKGFPDLVRKESEKFPFRIEMGPGGTGPSDFESFYRKEIPVLCFFTGMHDEYHTPADVVALINAGPGHYLNARTVITITGQWQLRVTIRSDPFNETTVAIPAGIH